MYIFLRRPVLPAAAALYQNHIGGSGSVFLNSFNRDQVILVWSNQDPGLNLLSCLGFKFKSILYLFIEIREEKKRLAKVFSCSPTTLWIGI